jgi:chromosome partitioning protein
MAVGRTIVFAQGKGGVGKTSLTSNVAGLVAAAGSRVLIIDLDQQGNVARDFGYKPSDGEDLLDALISRSPLPITAGVRENLDVVAGGSALGDLAAVFMARAGRNGETLADVLETKLTAIAGEYDLIVIDTPPGDRLIVEAALSVATAVAIPTRMDEASIDGVSRIAERFLAVRDRNPDLRLAGVILFAIASRAARLERDVRAALEDILGGSAPVFQTRIRHLDSAAADARRRGLLIHELEHAARDDRSQRLAALKQGARPTDSLYARDASGLAGDYEALAQELVQRLIEIENETAVHA